MHRSIFAIGVSAIALSSASGAAQSLPESNAERGIASDSPAEEENVIVVTGSRIPRADIDNVAPTTVVSSAELANTGIVNAETALQRLPANAGFAGNQTSAYWTGNGYGTAQVNLRGLGIKRTLVLLNGRRLVAGGTGANSSPDLNMIPVAAIGRIEVLKDGASAIYGADAVAGVVNIITQTDFEGFKASGRYGITDRGDGSDLTANLLWGVQNERGGFTAAATYQNTSAINLASRAPCSLAEVTPGELSCVNSASTVGGRAVLPNGDLINFNNDPNGDGDFFEPYSPAKHNFNSAPFLNAVSPIERVSTAFFGHYDLTDSVTAFGEFLYTHRESDQIATPGTLRNLSISAENPTNPTGQDIVLAQRRLAEPGPRQFFQETDTWQGTLGVRGDIANGWRWELAGAFGRNTAIDGSTNIANLERVGNTLDREVCGTQASAAIPCGDYLGAGDLSADVLNYILFTSRDTGGNELATVTADLNGSLFALPGGDAAFATGLVYRREKGFRNPDPLTVMGVANTNQQEPISGTSEAREAYLELSLPILADVPFAQSLTLDGAVRYSDYDLFGSDWNYKGSVDWQPFTGVRLRGTYGTGFRIPNVPELFGGVSEGNLTTTDPCSQYSSSGNATLIANCQASGVPADYVQLGTSILTTVGGNEDLQPESSKSWTVGTVLEPAFAPGLSLTVDWYDIEIDDAIRAIPGSTKLAVCYASENLSSAFCDDFTRSSLTGEVTFLSAQPINTGKEEISGLDIGAAYRRDFGDFSLSADVNISYLNEYVISPFPGGDAIEFDGFIGGGNGGYPKWRGYGILTAEVEQFSATWSTQWIGKATDFNADADQIGYRTPNVFYHNIQLAYRVDDRFRVNFGVDNLFDRKAPYIPSFTDGNTDTMTYDLMWRRFYVGVQTEF
ncbi:TonB-dependent receptor domain-containing protein [Pacificimonas flava]|uniref:TonB-dependent receptor n=1 Tax=Pacificimonas flava TaxID=1234595 RepID=M2U5V3_9SPHN|nr:TonB-dependent receptor [Pacificimonas flava]EMD83368.1 TonB-dependent receptor [Pacificimonas flava]MBB5279070.1 outer membrane receptor protein involved in Fe transport [Pacificimonas flava]